MDSSEQDRLSRMSTWWTIVCQANDGSVESRQVATALLFKRYETAVRRYLMAMVRDQNIVDELFQSFAEALLTGKFRNADPEKGKFRFYLKTSLQRFVYHHYRDDVRRKEQPLPDDFDVAAASQHPISEDQESEIWRKELFANALRALRKEEEQAGTNRYLYTVLRMRVDNPKMTAESMFEQLRPMVGDMENPAGWIRKKLHIARERFCKLLIEEVAQTLSNPTIEAIEEELVALRLRHYCSGYLDRIKSD